MSKFDAEVYDQLLGQRLRCKVCNSIIVMSYHKKHVEQKCHLNKMASFNKNDDKLEEFSRRVYDYNKLKNQANIMKKYIVKDLDEYREQNKPTENDYNSFVQQCKVNSLVEELGMI